MYMQWGIKMSNDKVETLTATDGWPELTATSCGVKRHSDSPSRAGAAEPL